jgi:hypothetical protein
MNVDLIQNCSYEELQLQLINHQIVPYANHHDACCDVRNHKLQNAKFMHYKIIKNDSSLFQLFMFLTMYNLYRQSPLLRIAIDFSVLICFCYQEMPNFTKIYQPII